MAPPAALIMTSYGLSVTGARRTKSSEQNRKEVALLTQGREAARTIGWTPADLRRFLVKVALISAVLNVLMLGGSFFMLLVYDNVIPSRSLPTLVGLLVMITVVYAFQALLDLVRTRAMLHVGGMVDQKLSDRVFRILIGPELGQAEGIQPVRDLDLVRSYLSGPGPLALLDLPWVLLFLGILFMFHVALGLVATAGAVVLIILTLLTDRVTRVLTTQTSTIAATRFAMADSSRRNAEVLQALGMTGRVGARWKVISDQLLAAQERAAKLSGGMSSASKTFRMLLQSSVLATGAALVISDKASGGVIIAGSILSSRALAPVDHSIANWKGLVAARQAWGRLEALLRLLPADRLATQLPAPQKSLSIDRLTAGPPGTDALAFRDVSFTVQAGDVLGIIGPSGSGKTSLLRAIVGVWPAERGTVRLDNATTDQWSRDDLGRHVGYLPQDVELFDGTVAQNIARFDPHATKEAVFAAARAADIHDLVVKLPEGYDSQLGPNGSNLSAGQRQRVGLARALYGDPFLIVLDEPNSNLDTEGERALGKAISTAAKRGAIVLLVAHRPSALQEANRILYLTEGRTRLLGERNEVLAKLGLRLPAPAAAPSTPRPIMPGAVQRPREQQHA